MASERILYAIRKAPKRVTIPLGRLSYSYSISPTFSAIRKAALFFL